MDLMNDVGLIQRLRQKLTARRGKSQERAHKRREVAAERASEDARRRKHIPPPNVGGGFG